MSFAISGQTKRNKVGDSKTSTSAKYHSSTSPHHNHNRISNSAHDSPHSALAIHLQRAIGNQAVQRLMRPNASGGFDFAKIAIQPKLKISQPRDEYEQEADRVAEEIMKMSASDSIAPTATRRQGKEGIDRKCSGCEMAEGEEEVKKNLKISRKPSSSSNLETTNEVSSEISNVRSNGGSLLDANTRGFMESRFGHDFSKVRIYM